ncbi:Hydrolase OS=Streptomyces tendae OX=1932 GN=GUR47_17890 PE=4 SV=1 [Streptomyces tendae]
MRVHRNAAAGCALLFALAAAGCAGQDGTTDPAAPATPTAPSAPSASSTPATGYAPYVSATTASATDTAGSPTAYNLAFVIASGDDCVPRWNGVQDIDDASVASRVEKLKESGATVRVSFGGASGTELAAACDSASALAAAYGAALDAAGSTQADFDVEGDELADADSVTLRSEAIALLQEERSGLEVSFTLPVMPSRPGRRRSGAARRRPTTTAYVVSAVNLMTMNYGESYTDDMGDYALASAKAVHETAGGTRLLDGGEVLLVVLDAVVRVRGRPGT